MDKLKDFFSGKMNQPEFKERYEAIVEKTLSDPDIQTFLREHKEELTEKIIQKSYAKFNEYIVERDARIQGKEVKSPGLEPVLQMNVGFVDVVYTPTPAYLQHQKERELRSRVSAYSMPKDIKAARFSKFDMTVERSEALNNCLRFVENIVSHPEKYHQGLYLTGPFGVGKTYLLGATANELAKNGIHSTLLHVPTLSLEMKQAIGNGSLQEKVDTIKKTEVLMLDDIGAESNTAWFRDEILGAILQYRMLQELPTFFSSNFTIAELEGHFSVTQKGDQEEMKAKRLIERVRFLAEECQLQGKNRRPK